ncbi:hypothetical protein E4U19_003496 [Claviceps sp. Clav32 group G5]|nr:hypothetical protein E4U40_003035 [Claviceps sp. LM458 group G5]KAG6024886.1 hypothetical protein E4U19_003496 [Claviceps sp. Clav32 group G5]KAG6044916.1 hypothetical protein E4U39_002902 [Claviceps sp. Clav50 group G5]
MKFSAILSSLAISALQVVHALPTEVDSAAIEDIHARSPNTLEERGASCCVVYQDALRKVADLIPSGNGQYSWSLPGRCYMTVNRNANGCKGWTFTPTATCDGLSHYSIGTHPLSDC